MRGLAIVLFFVLTWGPPAGAQPSEGFAKANRLVEELDYSGADKALSELWSAKGLDRKQTVELLSLWASVEAALGKSDQARRHFRMLLAIQPDYEFTREDMGPQVQNLYYEAKGWAVLKGGLSLTRGEGSTVKVEGDLLGLGSKVRFLLPAGEGKYEPQTAPITDGQAKLELASVPPGWQAELLGENDHVIAELSEPVKDRTLDVQHSHSRHMPWRPVAYAAMGAGALALGAGAILGVSSAQLRGSILDGPRDAFGRVNGLTRDEALQREAQATSNAIWANTLLISGALLGGAGVGLYFLGPSTTLRVGPAGVAVAGAFF